MKALGWILIGGAAYLLVSRGLADSVMGRPSTPAGPGMQWAWNGFQWTQIPQGAIAL